MATDEDGNNSTPMTPNSGMLYGEVETRPAGIKSSKRALLRNNETKDLAASSGKLTSLLSDISLASISNKEDREKHKDKKLQNMEMQLQQDAARTTALIQRTAYKEKRERRLKEKEEKEYLLRDISHLTGQAVQYAITKKDRIFRAQQKRY